MKKFKLMDRVLVKSNSGPMGGHEFQARIVDTAPNGEWIVEDQDSDFFTASENEMELIVD
jgi:hypothetical protein